MPGNKTRLEIVARRVPESAKGGRAGKRPGAEAAGAPRVSGRWLVSAVALTIGAAALFAWLVLCLLFWQGSWQLLYHPAAAVERTPAGMGLTFDPVALATTEAGEPRLRGWWVPAAPGAAASRFTVLFLHGQNGNLGDTVDALARLHAAGVNVLAFDYRGYGQSQFARPSEAHWRQDAEWALAYLEGTRHIDPATIVLVGTGLGANLALEAAAGHPELAGVVLDAPVAAPVSAIFDDARARLVPAHLLVRDRYDLDAAAAAVRIPVLWLERAAPPASGGSQHDPEAYERVAVKKMLVWLSSPGDADKQEKDALARWLDELPAR